MSTLHYFKKFLNARPARMAFDRSHIRGEVRVEGRLVLNNLMTPSHGMEIEMEDGLPAECFWNIRGSHPGAVSLQRRRLEDAQKRCLSCDWTTGHRVALIASKDRGARSLSTFRRWFLE